MISVFRSCAARRMVGRKSMSVCGKQVKNFSSFLLYFFAQSTIQDRRFQQRHQSTIFNTKICMMDRKIGIRYKQITNVCRGFREERKMLTGWRSIVKSFHCAEYFTMDIVAAQSVQFLHHCFSVFLQRAQKRGCSIPQLGTDVLFLLITEE